MREVAVKRENNYVSIPVTQFLATIYTASAKQIYGNVVQEKYTKLKNVFNVNILSSVFHTYNFFVITHFTISFIVKIATTILKNY